MERLKQLEKIMQDINIEIGAFALLREKGESALHNDQYYANLLTSREYLKEAIKYMKITQTEIYKELGSKTIN